MAVVGQEDGKDGDGWSLGLSVDWEKRLQVDPVGSLRELRRLCGRARPATEKLENTYWRALLAGASDDELAAAVLLRLRPEADFRQSLLQIGGEHAVLLHQHFNALAVSRLGETEIDFSDWDEATADALCLDSNTLEDFRKLNEAAAFYALAHDLVGAAQAGDCFERLALRFGICRCLFPPEEPPGDEVQLYLNLANRTLDDLSAEPLRKVLPSIRKPLRFKLHYWLGKIQAKTEELEAAAESFRMAAECAGDVDNRALCKINRANALEKTGNLQGAFAEYCEIKPFQEDIAEEAIRRAWRRGYEHLKSQLQGEVDPAPVATKPAVGQELTSMAKEILSQLLLQLSGDPESSIPGLPQEVVLKLVEKLENEIVEELGRQPTAGARGRHRRLFQQPIEAAMICLLGIAKRAGIRSPAGQQALARAWACYQAVRNPELRVTILRRPANQEPAQKALAAQLEKAFHGALRRSFVEANNEQWPDDLERLQEHEAAFISDQRTLGRDGIEAPTQEGLSLILFEVTEMVGEPFMFAVAFFEGFYSFRYCPPPLFRRLADWTRRRLFAASSQSGTYRLFEVQNSNKSENVNVTAPAIEDIIPAEIFSRKGNKVLEVGAESAWRQEEAVGAKRFPVRVYPTGLAHRLLLEVLPQESENNSYFGVDRAIYFCLRTGREGNSKLDLRRGWLGVGGVPANKPFNSLPGTTEEILGIKKQLLELGVAEEKVCILENTEATVPNLEAKLASLSPVVLHLAVHGLAHEDHPEACALVLAPTLGQPEQDLLFFRKICQLPLAGIELVVLSACGSLIGRSNHGVGMQGLAWAFLNAGARQVIASRYKVDDDATQKFMLALYRGLVTLPPAEALGRARQECSAECMLSVGAWSIWS